MNESARTATRFRLTHLVTLVALPLVWPSLVSVASAHHSAAASYEANASIRIGGKVIEFAWTNPHCHVYIEVSEGPFKGRTYAVELGSPGAMLNDGWTRTLLQSGDDVVMSVHPSRVGAPVGLCRNCPLRINGKATTPWVSGVNRTQ